MTKKPITPNYELFAVTGDRRPTTGDRCSPLTPILRDVTGGVAMNKSDLIEVVAEKSALAKKKAEEVVDLIFRIMTQALAAGERIELRGLGSFTVKEYKAYQGRNPRSGESIAVKPKRLPYFKVGKDLRERVDGQK